MHKPQNKNPKMIRSLLFGGSCQQNDGNVSKRTVYESVVFDCEKVSRVNTRVQIGEKLYQCSVCQKSFTSVIYLSQHMGVHTGEKPCRCYVCSKSFTTKGNLSRHMREHCRTKPYQCSVCQKSFTLVSHLVQHVRGHTGERPYQCSVCQKSFSLKGILKTHMRVHTGEKPYPCSVCQKSFRQTSNLNMHMRMHTEQKPYQDDCGLNAQTIKQEPENYQEFGGSCHQNDGNVSKHTGDQSYESVVFDSEKMSRINKRVQIVEKLYQCSVCQKSYTQMRNLNSHFKVHTRWVVENPYHCSVCQKSFTKSATFKNHTRKHAGKKPNVNQCSVCQISFKKMITLNRHMRVHTGETPYQCPVCQISFTNWKSRNMHMRKHTGQTKYQHENYQQFEGSCHQDGEQSFDSEKMSPINMFLPSELKLDCDEEEPVANVKYE